MLGHLKFGHKVYKMFVRVCWTLPRGTRSTASGGGLEHARLGHLMFGHKMFAFKKLMWGYVLQQSVSRPSFGHVKFGLVKLGLQMFGHKVYEGHRMVGLGEASVLGGWRRSRMTTCSPASQPRFVGPSSLVPLWQGSGTSWSGTRCEWGA